MGASTWVRTPELDAFGPWILTVRTADDVPPLFRPANALAGARLALKIPRSIERRDAMAGMDLYDRMVLVRDDGIELLSRAPEVAAGWERRWVPAGDLLATEDSTDLLDGLLRLHLAGGDVVEVPYNGSSSGAVRILLDEIRSFWRPPGAADEPVPPLPLDALGPDDVALVNLQRELRRHDPRLRPLVLRRRLTATRRGNGLVHALRDAWPTTLQAAVVSTTGSELVVVHRRAWLVRGYRPVHSLATTVVPLTRGVRVDATDDLHRPGIRRLRLAPTSVTLLAVRDDGVEDAVARLLGGR